MMFRTSRMNHQKSVMFSASYDDGRTAYFVVENHGGTHEDYLVVNIAKQQQEAGVLPEGTIVGIKRVR